MSWFTTIKHWGLTDGTTLLYAVRIRNHDCYKNLEAKGIGSENSDKLSRAACDLTDNLRQEPQPLDE